MALRDQPYLPLYIQDFLTDEKLIECSAAATGVYIRVMCIMHKSEEYGKVLLRQKDQQSERQVLNFAEKLSKGLPYKLEIIVSALEELISEGVLHVVENALIQKRMVKDCELSNKRSNSGKKGAEISNTNSRIDKFAERFASANISANTPPKVSANSENEYVIENESLKQIGVEFEKFWENYPNKVDRVNAERAWSDLEPQERTIATAKALTYRPDMKYCLSPVKWLKNKRFNDAVQTGKQEPPKIILKMSKKPENYN